jgi:hypothetical protein
MGSSVGEISRKASLIGNQISDRMKGVRSMNFGVNLCISLACMSMSRILVERIHFNLTMWLVGAATLYADI